MRAFLSVVCRVCRRVRRSSHLLTDQYGETWSGVVTSVWWCLCCRRGAENRVEAVAAVQAWDLVRLLWWSPLDNVQGDDGVTAVTVVPRRGSGGGGGGGSAGSAVP